MINPNYPSYSPSVAESEPLDLTPITDALEDVKVAVMKNVGQKEVEVSNIDSVKLYLRQELGGLFKQLKPVIESLADSMPEAVEEVTVKNFPKQEKVESVSVDNLSELGTLLTDLIQSVNSLNVNPIVNVPAPIVHIPEQPAPIVNIPPSLPQMPTDLSGVLSALQPLRLLSRDPNKPITVRVSDGRSFVDAITKVLETSGERLATVVSTSYGLTKGEYKEAEQELYKSVSATNTKVSVLNSSTSVSTAKARKSIILSNDSDTVIYVAKGATAVVNEGIRVNASGGTIIIEDWDGAISAISSVTGKNLCICEVI